MAVKRKPWLGLLKLLFWAKLFNFHARGILARKLDIFM
jgi:hypothetical protein